MSKNAAQAEVEKDPMELAEEEAEKKVQRDSKGAYLPKLPPITMLARIKSLKTATTIRVGGEEKYFFQDEQYSMKLFSNNLVKVVKKTKPQEHTLVPLQNVSWFTTLDYQNVL